MPPRNHLHPPGRTTQRQPSGRRMVRKRAAPSDQPSSRRHRPVPAAAGRQVDNQPLETLSSSALDLVTVVTTAVFRQLRDDRTALATPFMEKSAKTTPDVTFPTVAAPSCDAMSEMALHLPGKQFAYMVSMNSASACDIGSLLAKERCDVASNNTHPHCIPPL